MLWAFLEASTLSGAALIYHDRDKLSLEATWKYLFVSSIGVTLGFAGIMFLSIAAHNTPNYINDLVRVAPDMNLGWIKTSFIFVLAGFSVKMGIVPLFTIDIDAKDSSPSPIGAMFSGPLMSVGFVAIYRFYQIYAHTSILAWMNHVLLLTGVLSLFLAAVFILKTNNFKRLLAYSSMEHAGLILIAFSTGVNGYLVAILHLTLHAFAKAGLFFQIGQVHRTYQSKIEEECGDYFKVSPVGSMALLAGLLAIVAMPPSGLFMTEFLLFKSLMISGQWWIVFVVMFLLCFFVYSIIRKFFTMIFIANPNARVMEQVNPLESLSPLLLIGGVLIAGVFSPDFLIRIIQQAILVLPQ
jgi:hydrogenase-4 component F